MDGKAIAAVVLAVAPLSLTCLPAFAQHAYPFKEGTPAYRVLASERETIVRHFAGYTPSPEVQSVRRGAAGRAYLVFFRGAGPAPLLFATDARGKIAWRDYDPLADVKGYHYHTRIAADVQGNVLLVYSGTDPWGVHARLFDNRGKRAWTTRVTESDAYHVSAIAWPERGWVVAYGHRNPDAGGGAPSSSSTGAQMLDRDGRKRWGERGRTLSDRVSGHSPVSLIRDTPDSALAVWYRWEGGVETQAAFVGQRLSPEGTFLWKSPAYLGEAPRFGLAAPREIALSAAAEGGAYADLYRGIVNDVQYRVTEYRVRISPDATVQTLSEREVGVEGRFPPAPAEDDAEGG